MAMKWYVVQAYSGYENKVRESLAVLEAEYLAKTSSFTQSKATDLGLVVIVSKEFATAERTLGVLDTRPSVRN